MRLVVDLDGTLLRSDMLFESFWSAIGQDWKSIFGAILTIFRGRAALKKFLAESSKINVSVLPFDPKLIEFVKSWRENGGKTALVTASNTKFAADIAAHLGIFDEVHGSDETTNLKGAAKGKFLVEKFSQEDFVYVGDSSADLAVWEKSSKAITVNASNNLRNQVEKMGKPFEHLTTVESSVRPYLKALRPHQWLKNLLVFVPILTSHNVNTESFLNSIAAFLAFSLVASSVYILNDLLDLESDRIHPRKRNRPFASGNVPISHGSMMIFGPITLGIIIATQLSWEFLLVMLCYTLITTTYSLYFKRLVVFDVCLLALLYTTRILAGGIATDITLSVWLLAFSIFFFFSLAAVKRQAELVDLAKRKNLSVSGRGYHVDDLPIISMIAIGSGYVSVLVLALYINSPEVLKVYSNPTVLWGICCILLYWVTNIAVATHRGTMHDDPIIYAIKDRVSQFCGILILVCLLVGSFL